MQSRFGHTAHRTLVDSRISSVSRRLTIPPRMDSHTDDHALWEAVLGDSLLEGFPGTLHLNHPDKRLAFFVAYQSVPFLVQGDEVELEVGGVGNDANHHSGKNLVDA